MDATKSNSSLRWGILSLACVMMVGNYYCYDNPAALHEPLKRRFSDKMSENDFEYYFNLLYSVYSIPNIVLPFFGGFLIAKVGNRAMLLVFAALIVVGQIIFTVGVSMTNMKIMLFGRVVFGLGGESINVSQMVMMTDWFRGKEVALAMGLNLSIARFGSAINDVTSPRLSTAYGLDNALWIGAFICIISLICAAIVCFIDRAYEKRHPEIIDHAARDAAERISLSDAKEFPKVYWLLTASCFVTYATILPFMNIAQSFVVKTYHGPGSKGEQEEMAATYMAATFFVGACFAPIVGVLVDKFGKRAKVTIVSSLLIGLAHVLFRYLFPLIPFMILGLGYTLYGSSVWPSISYVIKDEQEGTAYGLTTAVQNLGLAVTPLLVALLYSFDSQYTYVSLFFIILSGVGVGIGIWLTREDLAIGGILDKNSEEATALKKNLYLKSNSSPKVKGIFNPEKGFDADDEGVSSDDETPLLKKIT